MVTASVLAVAWGARDRTKPQPPKRTPVAEVPWLSQEAAAQIVGTDGTLGPLFANVTLGSLAPSGEERARIAEFARANKVAIDLEVVDDELVAIRFDVSYSGCCGYEGAEVLALRAHRPITGGGCVGGPERWVNAWTMTPGDGTFLHASVDINRVSFRWEQVLTTDEVLARADQVFDAETAEIARSAGERWRGIARQQFALELPYSFDSYDYDLWRPRNGIVITADRGRVAELSLSVRPDGEHTLGETLKGHWGRPSVRGSLWTWRKADRIIQVDVDEGSDATITMRRRAV